MIDYKIKTKTVRPNLEISEKKELYRILYGLLLMADPEEWLIDKEVDMWQDGQSTTQPFLCLLSTLDAR